MAIDITNGYSIPRNESAPGVLNFWILDQEVMSVTVDGTSNQITAFVTASGTTPVWHAFQCDNSEGNWSQPFSAGSGGREFISSATYRTGGISQSQFSTLDELSASARMPIVAEGRDGNYIYISRNGFSATAGTMDSGTGGGGALSAGVTYTFAAQDGIAATQVTVVTDLDAITAAMA